ncbi:LlaJI family restriction endonuclease [Pontibacter populi]|uniref:LlaJI family restriction endonuclease n=1 Tax=Pontibacter populi TaxID=890055 RepID=A0ABV1RSM1_9BACT
MNTVSLLEGKKYRIEYICEVLQASFAEVDSVLRDVTEYLKGEQLSFRFVGFIFWKRHLLVILPKYYLDLVNQEYIEHRMLLMQTLLKCQKHRYSDLSLLGVYSSDFEEEISEAGAALYLIEDFLSYGYWNRQENTIDQAGDGEILWDSTIDNYHPYKSGNNITYLEFNRRNSINTGDLITSYHQWAITVLWEKYGELLGFPYPIGEEEYSYGADVLSARATDYFDIEFLKHAIAVELQRSFRDRDIRLLKYLLFLLIDEESDTYDTKQVSLYGTTEFHIVWEKMCGFLFRNQYEDYKRFIPKPLWEDSEGRTSQASYTIRPDITIFHPVSRQFLILDAKYYFLNFDYSSEFRVHGGMDTYDIIKQQFYELVLRDKADLHEYVQSRVGQGITIERFRSMFLLPSLECEHYQYIGNVSLKDFQLASRINLFRLNPIMLMNRFVLNKPYSDQEIDDVISVALV